MGYSYQIGKYELTVGKYADFLNAVDPNGMNPHGIYHSLMGSNLNIAGISFTAGASAGSKCAVIGPSGCLQPAGITVANRPISDVTWFDAARFANWMTNGQGSGSTEIGA